MMPRLSARDRRALVAGAAVLVPVLALQSIVRPAARFISELRTELESERNMLAREERMIMDAPQFPRAIAHAERALSAHAVRLFHGDDAMAGLSAIGLYVDTRARESGLVMRRSDVVQLNADSVETGRLRIAIQAAGDLDGMLRLLHALETGPKLLRVNRLSITAPASPAYGNAQQPLLLSAEVEGYAGYR